MLNSPAAKLNDLFLFRQTIVPESLARTIKRLTRVGVKLQILASRANEFRGASLLREVSFVPRIGVKEERGLDLKLGEYGEQPDQTPLLAAHPSPEPLTLG